LKKFLVALFILVLSLCGATGGLAAVERYLCVNGQFISVDVNPRVEKGRVMVPARPVVEAVNGSIKYDQITGTATVEYQDKTITFTLGSWRYDVNGRQGVMDIPVALVNDRLLVPSTFFNAAMGLDTYTEGIHGDVIIKSR